MLDTGTVKFDRLESLKQLLRQSFRQHQWDSNTRYMIVNVFEMEFSSEKDMRAGSFGESMFVKNFGVI